MMHLMGVMKWKWRTYRSNVHRNIKKLNQLTSESSEKKCLDILNLRLAGRPTRDPETVVSGAGFPRMLT